MGETLADSVQENRVAVLKGYRHMRRRDFIMQTALGGAAVVSSSRMMTPTDQFFAAESPSLHPIGAKSVESEGRCCIRTRR